MKEMYNESKIQPTKRCDVVIGNVYYTKYGEPVKIGDKVRWMTLLTGMQEGILVKATNMRHFWETKLK